MAKELKAFQEASVEAIVQHFKEHDRALCADEAGLGKTIIARGIISELANEKLDVEAYAEQLKIWWDTFTEKAKGLSNDFMRRFRENTDLHKANRVFWGSGHQIRTQL